MTGQVVWVDIPVVDLDRAIAFYSAVLDLPVKRVEYPGFAIGLLPHAKNCCGACLFVEPGPRHQGVGPLIYLNVEGRLDYAVHEVTLKGGEILQPPHPIGPFGIRAVIRDSEGNKIALHAPPEGGMPPDEGTPGDEDG